MSIVCNPCMATSLINSTQVVYTVATGLAIYACLVGMGRLSQDLNAWQQSQAMKYYIIWILTYVVALATVKSSICITIMRIASTKLNLRITIYVLLAITWASFFTTFIGTLLYCRPVRSIWTPQLILSGQGTCAKVETFVIIGHVATVTTILTDLALVVVPAIILWNTQMKKQAKLQAFGLLSFASVYDTLYGYHRARAYIHAGHPSSPWCEFHTSISSRAWWTCSVSIYRENSLHMAANHVI